MPPMLPPMTAIVSSVASDIRHFLFYGFVFVNAICNEGDKVDSDYVNGNK